MSKVKGQSKSKRQPQQSRARNTIYCIQMAAAQILRDEGYRAASTNKIAEVAGVSVGSVYQYFSSKEDIFEGIIHADMSATIEKLRGFELDAGKSKQDNLRTFIIIGNQMQFLRAESYGELFRHGVFRKIMRAYSQEMIAEIERILRRLEIKADDGRRNKMAQVIFLGAQSLGLSNYSQDSSEELINEFLTMITTYVFRR